MAKQLIDIVNRVSRLVRGADATTTQRPTKAEIIDAVNDAQRGIVDMYPDLIFTQGLAEVDSYYPDIDGNSINTPLFDEDKYGQAPFGAGDDYLSYDATLNIGMEAQKINIARTPLFIKNLKAYFQKDGLTAPGTTFRIGIVPDNGNTDGGGLSCPPNPADFVSLGIKWTPESPISIVSTTMTLLTLQFYLYTYQLIGTGDYWVIIQAIPNALATNPRLRIRRYITAGTPGDTPGLNPYYNNPMSRYTAGAWTSDVGSDIYLELEYANIDYDYPITLTENVALVNSVDYGIDYSLKEYPHNFEQFNGGVPPGSFAMAGLSDNKLQIKVNPAFYYRVQDNVAVNNPSIIGTGRLPDIRAKLRPTYMSADGDYPVIPDRYSDLLELKAFRFMISRGFVLQDVEDVKTLDNQINKREISLVFDYKPRGAKSMINGSDDSVNDGTFRSVY